MAEIGRDIEKAARILREGGLVAIPTETVYGLAANALSPDAVIKIFEVKQRPSFDPLIVHVKDAGEISEYALSISSVVERLTKKFWPGPLTVLIKKKSVIPDIVTSGLDTVGLRCPAHPLTLSLLEKISFPLAAPSANPFGFISPTTPQHVNEQLGDKISYILDGGACEVGVESTIIGWEGVQPVIYRPGGLPKEALEQITGKITDAIDPENDPLAPGQLKSHYAPHKKLLIGDVEGLLKEFPDRSRVAVIGFQKEYDVPNPAVLSSSGDLSEAAKNLFRVLRELDKSSAEVIIAEYVPQTGIGVAINDRLKRAAAK